MKPTRSTSGTPKSNGWLSFVISLCCIFCTAWPSYAQTVWTGEISSEWNNPANWSAGLPVANEEVAVPTQPNGNFFPLVSTPLTINFDLTIASQITFAADVTNQGSLTCFEGAIIYNQGDFSNLTVFDNDGSLLSSGAIYNAGAINHSGALELSAGQSLRNETDASFESFGSILIGEAQLINHGDFRINGSSFVNTGLVENHANFWNNGTIKNQQCGIFYNLGMLENSNLIENDNIFYNQNTISGNAILETWRLPELPGQILADASCTDSEGWTHYFNTATGHLLLSIQKNGLDIGMLDDQSLAIEASTSPKLASGDVELLREANYLDADQWLVLNRYWKIQTTMDLDEPLPVRFYYQDQDMEDIKGRFPLIQNDQELFFYQLPNANLPTDANIPADKYREFAFSANPSTDTWSRASISHATFAEMNIELSNAAVYGAACKVFAEGTIPYQLSFTALAQANKSALLTWEMAREIDAQAFIVETSKDSINFEAIETIAGAGNTMAPKTYQFIDLNPDLEQSTFYRIRQIRSDGSFRLSSTKSVSFLPGEVRIFPNPSTSTLFVHFSTFEEGFVDIRIFNMNGQLKYEETIPVSHFTTTENILDKIYLNPGIYTLQVRTVLENQSSRFIKIAP